MLRPHLQSANISYSMQKRLLFKIDYVCEFPSMGSRVIFGWQSTVLNPEIWTENRENSNKVGDLFDIPVL